MKSGMVIMNADKELKEKIQNIKLIALDVDGVLTDGGILLGNAGAEMKIFNVQDGMGITLAREAGLITAIITGRESEAVERRAKELKIDAVHQGAFDKTAAYEAVLKEYDLHSGETCYMGDDLLDLCIMRRAAVSAAPADARKEVRDSADIITRASGGRGAVRELVELILQIQGRWDTLVQRY